MNDKIKEQLEALKFALDLAQKQVSDLEERLKDIKFEELSLDEQKTFLNNDVPYLYLMNFWNQYDFLFNKLNTEKSEDIHFYLPFLRSLIETYGELLYFLHQDGPKKLGIFVGNYLLYFSDNYRFITDSELLKNEYTRFLGVWGNLLKSESIAFPEEIDKLSNKVLGKMSFSFPNYEEIFKDPFFKTVSEESFENWPKDDHTNFYNKYYRVYSSYTHKSFTNQVKGKTNNEIYWMIQFLYLIGQLMFELLDKTIFEGKYKTERKEYVSKIASAHKNMEALWHREEPKKGTGM
jgi:hypothetical protein